MKLPTCLGGPTWSLYVTWEVGVGDFLVGKLQSQDHFVLDPLSPGTFPHSPCPMVSNKADGSTSLAHPALSSHPCLGPRINLSSG